MFEPYAGYFQAIPRLVALVATWLPVEFAPVLFLVISGLLLAFCLSEPASSRFIAVRGGPAVRTLVCAALCLSPGLNEVFGNIANLYAVVALWLLLIGAREAGTALRWPDRLALPLCAFTAGGAAVLFPLFAWRVVKYRRADDVFAAACIAAAALANAASYHSLPAATLASLGDRMAASLHALAYGMALAPLAGTIGAPRLWSFVPAAYLAMSALLIAALAAAALRDRTRETTPLAIAAACYALLPFLVSAVRSGSAAVLAPGPTEGFAWFRYSFQLAPVGLLAWTALLSRWPKRLAPWPALLLAALAFCLGVERWGLDEYYGLRWSAALEDARVTGACKSEINDIEIPIAPPGWRARIPKRALCATPLP